MKHIPSKLWAMLLLMVSVMLPSAVQADGSHRLTVVAKPTMAGSFNTNSADLVAGETIHLYAYSKGNFDFVHWTDNTGAVVSEQMDFTYIMPNRDVTLTAEYNYNPANPANPASNYWDKEHGVLIVDDFKAGSLYSAANNALGSSNSSEVSMLTVAGVISNNDFGIANYFSNCSVLDLSRVTGVTAVPSYAFDYTNCETVKLPATIEKIGYYAFGQCSRLTTITIYAMTPPTLESNVFSGVPDGLVVYVPAASIAQYQDTEAWSQFTLLPIQEDIRSISVSLPNGTKASDYSKMWLELTNTKSGQRMHYIMTERDAYTFANIIKNTSWNVVLRNERGDVFGKIDNVEVKDEDVSVSFASLTKPQNVSLTVKTPDGKNVTEQTQITWTDASGNYIAQGTSLSSLPVGCQLNYSVALSQDLAMLYGTPKAVAYTLKDGNNSLTCKLKAIKQVKVTGKVKDATSGLTLSGAVISASQTFGGKYSKTINGKTDANGVYTLTVYDVPTTMAFAATDYISQSIVCDELIAGKATVDMNDVSLKPISGATINVGFTYTSVDGETQNWYSDYQNVSYTLYNKTRKKAVSQFNVQYPQIVLLEEVSEGDVLELTAESKTQAFKPVKATATITANQTAEAQFSIVELGQLKVEYSQSGNVDVVASLYDASGKLVKTYNYQDMSLTVSNLADGNYTLVSMGSSQFFNSIYDLAQLPQSGLKAGTDYVQNAVTVKSGKVTTVNIDLVPKLDESKLYYTGDNTSFTVNKPSIVAGNYLTLTGRIDFKQAYATGVSNVQMIVDLPEACEFVENSVMVGNSTSSYALNGHQLTIPMPRYTDRVRFCVIPTAGGDYAPSAFAQFDLNGKTIKQPIGSANYTAKDLSISVPSIVAKTEIPVSGTAVGVSTVEIYDNGVLIGQTTSHTNGSWATTCNLNDPYNLSTHCIYAKVTSKNGVKLQSESKEVTYDMNAIEVTKVTMYHYNPEMHKTFESVFDFQNPSSKPNKWTVYYPDKKFTYTVEFTNNSPEKVSNVVLYVHAADGQIVELHPKYDASKDIWTADLDMGGSYGGFYPVNVSVDFEALTDVQLDATLFDNTFKAAEISSEEIAIDVEKLQNTKILLSDLFDNNLYDPSALSEALMLSRSLAGLSKFSKNIQNIEALSEEELKVYCENFLQTNESLVDDNMTTFVNKKFSQLFDEAANDIDGVSVENGIGKTKDELISEGYIEIKRTDNNSIYILTTDATYQIVDLANNRKITIDISNLNEEQSILTRGSSDNTLEILQSYLEKTESYWKTLKDYFTRIASLVEDVIETIDLKNGKIADEVHQLDYTIEWIKKQPYADKPYWKNLLKKYEKQRNKALDEAISNNKIMGWLEKNFSPHGLRVGKIGGGIFAVVDAGLVIHDACKDINKVMSLYKSIPDPCENDQERATNLKKKVRNTGVGAGLFYTAQLASDIAQVVGLFVSVPAIVPSGGTSLALVAASVSLAVANFLGCMAYEKVYSSRMNDHYSEALTLNCLKHCGEKGMPDCPDSPFGDDGNGNNGYGGSGSIGSGGGHTSGSPDDNVQIDPSGYVYEGVFSNRLQGVTATCYYKETVEDMYGDLHDNIVKWDAEEYAQENPLFTDENGYYRWDVPQGLWQVKFEKEGYETTYSEWLPVPPPQLDINIPMKQNVQPLVKSARAFQDAVEFEFDKYMMPELLTTENITVMVGKKAVTGTIKLLDEEVSREGETETFASKVRFNAAKPFEGKEVTLMVSNHVRSYAGIRMQDDFSQQFTIEEEVRQIDCKEMVKVAYGHNSSVSVAVLPASAAAAKTLRVKSSSAMILSTDAENLVLDKDGRAEIKVHGELPGTAALTFSVDGYDLTATTTVNVVTIIKGDANCDGEVNAADIVVLQNYLSGQHTTDIDESAADADGDGSITVADVLAIVAIILNKR